MGELLLNSIIDKYRSIHEDSLQDLDISNSAKLQRLLDFDANQIQQKILSIKRQAFKDVLLDTYKSYYRQEIANGKFDEIIPDLAVIRDGINNKNNSNYLWITINPRPSVNLIEFIKIVEKSLKKSWICKYLCVIEQRGCNEEEIGKGFHTHILIDKGDYRFSHARREFVSTYNKVCDVQNYHTFNFNCCKEIDINKRQNYMLGRKADPEKHIKQDMDIIFRNRYNIPTFYGEMFIKEGV